MTLKISWSEPWRPVLGTTLKSSFQTPEMRETQLENEPILTPSLTGFRRQLFRSATVRAFQHRVDFRSGQYQHRRQPHPRHEADQGSKRAIGLVVAAEVRGVIRKSNRERDPD